MIEIRELVIRATVEDSSGNNGRETSRAGVTETNSKGCCSDNIDIMLKILKDKKER